jgi:hypothetical protein
MLVVHPGLRVVVRCIVTYIPHPGDFATQSPSLLYSIPKVSQYLSQYRQGRKADGTRQPRVTRQAPCVVLLKRAAKKPK